MSYSSNDIYRRLLGADTTTTSRRKCFVSYSADDEDEVDRFVRDFTDVFIPKVIGVSGGDSLIDSGNSDYVMSRIRNEYLGDSTVTLCMIGNCTHSRRYIDWELKATLRRGTYVPNGLVGVLLPSVGDRAHLPPRFKDNWNRDESMAYGIYRPYPSTKAILRSWIEEAFSRRTSHTVLICNAQDMHRYNRKCSVHNVTH
jgi:hypothetical protein